MLPTLDQLEMAGKRVLVRADLNVPLTEDGVSDPARIKAAAPTIQEVIERGGKPVVMSHLGKPKGDRDPSLSLNRVRGVLSEALNGANVCFAKSIAAAGELARNLKPGEVILLENLRFDAGEKGNDAGFAHRLAGIGDVYVNDAFSAAHRAHASIVGVPKHLPSAAGRLMEREISSLEKHLGKPERPVMAILGGAKVSTKFGLLRVLVGRVDCVALAGGLANTLLAAEGKAVGRSIHDADAIDEAKAIRKAAEEAGCEILLPTDAVVAKEMKDDAPTEVVSIDAVSEDAMILDIGPESATRIAEHIADMRTLVWNGPLGAAEYPAFSRATEKVAKMIADRTRTGDLVSIVGGGDTNAAVERAGVLDDFTYVSLAGGAFLQWIEGRDLPGLVALGAARDGSRKMDQRKG